MMLRKKKREGRVADGEYGEVVVVMMLFGMGENAVLTALSQAGIFVFL